MRAAGPPLLTRGTAMRSDKISPLRRGLLLACLTLLLPACATTQPGVTRVERVPVLPPSALLADCPAPTLSGPTNDDLLRLAVERGEALRECTGDKRALRQWRAGHEPARGP